MKKLLSILGSFGIVASSASTAVACGGVKEIPFKEYNYGKDIGLITDTGKTDDKSFNQSGYEAGNDFVKSLDASNKDIVKVEPNTLSEIKTSYSKIIRDNNVNTLILPGFQHQDYIKTASKLMGDKRSAVFLDGDTNGTSNVIGLKYKADISGFYAGIASIIEYFQLNTSDSTVKLATFGGIANPVAVTSYMSGFMASIDAFNILVNDTTFYNTFFGSTTKSGLGEGERTLSAKRVGFQKTAPSKDDDASWFTNSFAAGDAKQISDKLVGDAKKGGLVVFPVAGPQTADVLAAIAGKNKMYVAGVDTDQVTQYTDYGDKFLTSGLKDLKGSTEIALAHTVEYKDKINQTALEAMATAQGINMNNMSFVDGTTDEAVTDAAKIAELKAAGSDWDKYEVWFDGSFAHGGNNKVTDNLHDSVIKYFDGKTLSAASKNFLDKAADSDSKSLLAQGTLDQWLKDAGIKTA